MRVHVDEAGGDDEAGGVELFATGLVDGADRGDAAVVDGHVGEHGCSPATVDHRSVADHEIVHVAFPPKGRPRKPPADPTATARGGASRVRRRIGS